MAEEKSPRDLSRAPDSIEEDEGLEARAGHGVRTTARVDVKDPETGASEVQQANYDRAVSEDFEHGRNTGAGPNPYTLQSVRQKVDVQEDVLAEALEYFGGYHMGDAAGTVARYLSYKESMAESDADDAEIPVLGDTITDSGQKIQLNPERVAADEKAVLPNVRARHQGLIDELKSDEDRGPVRDEQAAAFGEAQGTLDDDAPQYLGPPHPEDRRAGETYTDPTEGSSDKSEESVVTEDSEAKAESQDDKEK